MHLTKEGSGVLKRHKKKAKHLLLDPENFIDNGSRGIFVPQNLLQKYKLVEGATVTGPIRNGQGIRTWAMC